MNEMKREWTEEELARGEAMYRRFYESDNSCEAELLKQAVLCGCRKAAEDLPLFCYMEDDAVEDAVWEACYALNPEGLTACDIAIAYEAQGRKELAFKWYRLAVATGETNALYPLAYYYANGMSVAQDWGWALYWYRRAADVGDARALCNLGYCYWHGMGVAKDVKKGFRLIKQASEAGNAIARNNLGYMYAHGEGVRKNGRVAFRLFHEALELGENSALTNLGFCYFWGRGCEKDATKAMSYFRRAIEAGEKDCAAYNLAYRYRKGEGVERDFAQAWKYFRMAAANGYAYAYDAMGDMARLGEGLSQKDFAMALRYYRKGLKASNDEYCHAGLARCYEQGLGVKKDIRKAYEHLRAAQKAGYNGDRRLIRRITAKAVAAGIVP